MIFVENVKTGRSLNSLAFYIDEKLYPEMVVTINTLVKNKVEDPLIVAGLISLLEAGYEIDVKTIYLSCDYLSGIYREYLENAIREQDGYNRLNKEKKEIYNVALECGAKATHEGELDKAKDYYIWGYFNTGLPVFRFYLARTFQLQGLDEEAKNEYLEYTKIGSSKLLETYISLSSIENNRENHSLVTINYYKEYIKTLKTLTLTQK